MLELVELTRWPILTWPPPGRVIDYDLLDWLRCLGHACIEETTDEGADIPRALDCPGPTADKRFEPQHQRYGATCNHIDAMPSPLHSQRWPGAVGGRRKGGEG
eukprot:4039417-Pyramimonas_sp.AAC.1